MFSLLDMLGRAAPRLDIVDVGAMWMGMDEVAYKAMLKGDTHVIGFEPVQSECDKLNAMKMRNHTYLPYFVGDGTERTFYLCAASMTSSLYEPNMPLLSKFNQVDELTRPISETRVQTRRLDDIPQVKNVDFLKVDVQGADLDVLRGAQRHLQTCVAVFTEVEFIPMYKDQPLFADIDTFMRSQGFLLHSLAAPAGRALKPITPRGDANAMVNQIMWSDATYIKNFMNFADLEPDQLLKIAIIAHEFHGSIDLAALALQHYDAKTNKGLWKIYMTRLFGAVPPAPPL